MTQWQFKKFSLPPDQAAEAAKLGITVPRLMSNDGSVSVFEVDEQGEIDRLVCVVVPTTEVKRGNGHRHEDPERDAIAVKIAALPDLHEAHEVNLVDLKLLLLAVQAGDPKAELELRVGDILKRTVAALAKTEGPP